MMIAVGALVGTMARVGALRTIVGLSVGLRVAVAAEVGVSLGASVLLGTAVGAEVAVSIMMTIVGDGFGASGVLLDTATGAADELQLINNDVMNPMMMICLMLFSVLPRNWQYCNLPIRMHS